MSAHSEFTRHRPDLNKFDKYGQKLRFRFIVKEIKKLNYPPRILDVGCGRDNLLLSYLDDREMLDAASVGMDPSFPGLVAPKTTTKTLQQLAESRREDFDVVTSLAVLEHIPTSEVVQHISLMIACARSGGLLLLTTPSPRAKPLLEFLAFRLKAISPFEIADHKHYFTQSELRSLFTVPPMRAVKIRTFQFGFNTLVVAHKGYQTGRIQLGLG